MKRILSSPATPYPQGTLGTNDNEKGDTMDTIEILEAIGKNASYRHASGERLLGILSAMDASESLERTAKTGDQHHLAVEFGQEIVSMVQSQVQGGYEDQEDDEPCPERDGEDERTPLSPDS
ncbi:hypothetical protein GCM10027285_03940 [Oleiagrimonas citrea]|uniref:Uncharacterized protein n=1 Tax=Oleiagrimonas citrea TaxID=1665687 RepID=A0A846ZPQ8_9GAMM|nr:hypothetical protein [Oleiagrimonas citrea]NKZ39433.1 hypothetical protein [Oleiagrimonas citrea]